MPLLASLSSLRRGLTMHRGLSIKCLPSCHARVLRNVSTPIVPAMSIAFQLPTPGLLGYTGRDFHEALSPRFLDVEARRTDDHIISARANSSIRKCKCLRGPSLDRDGTSSKLRCFRDPLQSIQVAGHL
ncbi:hypothetical protein BJX68DRAFT_153359 [Aspergillus pseudodeflectus]|uniref:Uncharacterized protein n=1 Tax=Aspergillus pseudodeflectus TaxID=176178 RepID=A0ABR4JXZ3_9EURO